MVGRDRSPKRGYASGHSHTPPPLIRWGHGGDGEGEGGQLRRALASQAVQAFASFEAEPGLKFDKNYPL